MAVGGNSPARMNWPGTTANTQGTVPFSARSATGPFPGRTTSPYTWRGTFKSHGVDGTHTARRESSVFFLTFHTVLPRGEEPGWQALQSWSSSQQVSLWMDNQKSPRDKKRNKKKYQKQKKKNKEKNSQKRWGLRPDLLSFQYRFQLEHAWTYKMPRATGSCGYQGIR